MFEKFIEEALGAKCPKCHGEAMFWEVEAGADATLVDVLHCDECGFTWERVYRYECSRWKKD